VDYALVKRSRLADVRSGRVPLEQVCDADRYLLRAARFHGAVGDEACPVCRKEQVTLVSWVFGEHLGRAAGSARTDAEIAVLAGRCDEFTVHVVEVCRTCRWNQLVTSYVAGRAPAATRRRAAKA